MKEDNGVTLIRRRCEDDGYRLELVRILDNKFYLSCPQCGKVVIFTLTGGGPDGK